MNSDIYEQILSKLADSNLIEYFNETAKLPSPDRSTLTKLIKTPVKIFIKDNNLCYENEDGEAICCPEIDTNVSDAGYWLSDKIPSPCFDILQGGNLRKAEEAEAFYICCIITAILKDDSFTSEIEKVISNYDFVKMDSVEANYNFVNLLIDWQDLQSVIINVIVSASKYSISDMKKDSEQFLRAGLLQEEKDALRDLALNN